MTLSVRNKELETTCERMQCDLDVVDWYVEILEKGIKSQDIMQNYVEAQSTIKKLNKEFIDYRETSMIQTAKLTTKYKETYEQLVSLQEDVLKPLMAEVKIKEVLHARVREKAERQERYFKMMNAIIRLPLMVDQFQKAMKRRESVELLKRLEIESIQLLRQQNVTEGN